MTQRQMNVQSVKDGIFGICDGVSVTMTILYSFASDFFSYLISDEGLQKTGLVLTVIYLFFRCVYWAKKVFVGDSKSEE